MGRERDREREKERGWGERETERERKRGGGERETEREKERRWGERDRERERERERDFLSKLLTIDYILCINIILFNLIFFNFQSINNIMLEMLSMILCKDKNNFYPHLFNNSSNEQLAIY